MADGNWKTQADMIRSLGADYAGDLKRMMRDLAVQYNAGKTPRLPDGTEIEARGMRIDGVNRLVVDEASFPKLEKAVLAMAAERQDNEFMAYVSSSASAPAYARF